MRSLSYPKLKHNLLYEAAKLKASVQNHRIAWAGQDINQVPTPSYGQGDKLIDKLKTN